MKYQLTFVGIAAATAALTLTTPATGHTAPRASCGTQLSPAQIDAVGTSCALEPHTVIRVGPDLRVRVPERGVVASAARLSAGPSTGPTEVSVYRSSDDRLAVRIDDNLTRGDRTTAAKLADIVDREVPTPSAARVAAPSWCGSAGYYSLHNGRWSGSQYRWLYNSRTQPNTASLTAITYGFKFITDDSSGCGTNVSTATHSYRGTTTKYTWGDRDNYNVVGWAGYDPNTLAMAYWWTDSSGYKIEADIGFNNRITNWNTGLGGTVPSNRYDVISVATHEAGHVFGLDHYSHSTQVMNPSIGMGSNKRVKRLGDLAGMAAKY